MNWKLNRSRLTRSSALTGLKWLIPSLVLTVALQGYSQNKAQVELAPSLLISPQSLAFGSQTVGISTGPLTLTLQAENGRVSFYSLQVTGNAASDYSLSIGLCALKDAIYGCVVTVRFAPTAVGVRAATLSIADSAAGTPQSVPLSGTGVAQAPDIGLITTYAGQSVNGFRGDGSAATQAWLAEPFATLADSAGNLYIADLGNNLVRFVNAKTGLISTYAGEFATAGGYPLGGYSGDGGPANHARLNGPAGLALDHAGNLYISDSGNSVIRKVTASTGVISTVAGVFGNQCNYRAGQSGDGGRANQASLCFTGGLAFDAAENLYIADSSDSVVRRVDASTGIISTYAGSIGGIGGFGGFGGDGGPATQALMFAPVGIQFNQEGDLYIADTDNYAVRKVTASTGIITTVVGTGTITGFGGDGGPATHALLSLVYGISLDAAGNLYIADHDNSVLRKVEATDGTIHTVAGNGLYGYSGDGGPATSAEFTYPAGVSFDATGNFYVTDVNANAIRKIAFNRPVASIATPVFNLPAGPYFGTTNVSITDATPGTMIYYTLDGPVPSTTFPIPYTKPVAIKQTSVLRAVAVRGSASSITVSGLYTISSTPMLTLTPGSQSFGNVPVGASSQVNVQVTNVGAVPVSISGVTVAGSDALDFAAENTCSSYIGTNETCDLSVNFLPTVDGTRSATLAIDSNAGKRSISLSGIGSGIRVVSSVAGLTRGVYGNGGAAGSANLGFPRGVATDSAGNQYIADEYNSQIRKVNRETGEITVVAGTGQAGFSGDGQLAPLAQLNFPSGVVLDSHGNIYIADSGNSVIRKITAANGVITTYAGIDGQYGFSGDGGPATQAVFDGMTALALDTKGNLYIADFGNSVVREVNQATGIISTIAGTGDQYGYSGDGGPAVSATLSYPTGVAVDGHGNVYISDSNNYVIRKADAATGIITTYAGTGSYGYSGDGGPANQALLSIAEGMRVDSAGDLYFADLENNVIRKVVASAGVITTIAGNGIAGYSGNDGPATSAMINLPYDVAIDGHGNFFIADNGNNRVRQVDEAGTMTTIAGDGRFSPLPSGVAAYTAPLGTSAPDPVVMDANGNIYFSDFYNNVIRKIDASNHKITTVAGNGNTGYTGDGGPATAATLNSPEGLAIDPAGNLYIADTNNLVVRKVTAATGTITTFAGNGQFGFPGDGGPATEGSLIGPQGLAFDAYGDLYIATPEAFVIREVTRTGILETVAGNGIPYYGSGPNGDGGDALSASLGYPTSIAFDALGNLYIGGEYDRTVREVNSATAIINTVVGNGQYGDSGDGGPALSASISSPDDLKFDTNGDLFIADGFSIRIVNPAGIIETVIGQAGYGYSGDGGPVALAQAFPSGVAVDGASNVYFADASGNRIRKISTTSVLPKEAATPEIAPTSGSYSSTQNVTITDTTTAAQIFYTLDGSVPNPGTSSLYTGPLTFIGPVTISAIAIAPSHSTSALATASYTFPAGNPSLTPKSAQPFQRSQPQATAPSAGNPERGKNARAKELERLFRLRLARSQGQEPARFERALAAKFAKSGLALDPTGIF